MPINRGRTASGRGKIAAVGDLGADTAVQGADGRFVVFYGDSTNLVADDTNGSRDVFVRDRVAGVINVQHREPHFHSGGEMELLTTVGEQIGCLVALAQSDLKALETPQVLDLVMSPVRRS